MKKRQKTRVDREHHEKYHSLFSNRTPEEIIEYLVQRFWNSQWCYVSTALSHGDSVEYLKSIGVGRRKCGTYDYQDE